MELHTRNLLNRSFTLLSYLSIAFMVVALLVLLGPIFVRGAGAFVFQATVEHRKVERDVFLRDPGEALNEELRAVASLRAPIYKRLRDFKKELDRMDPLKAATLEGELTEVEDLIGSLIGPDPNGEKPVMLRGTYGATRWDQALERHHELLNRQEWDYSDPTQPGVQVWVPRAKIFAGTSLAQLFTRDFTEEKMAEMLRPSWTIYWRFITDASHDAHFFGGVWPEVLGTLYLTLGAMLFAVPSGVIAAIYLVEYARDSVFLSFLRSCISTLAGVPSIVFGLFGLAFFINSGWSVSDNKSVLAGSLTLGLLVLPTIIRSAEEAIRAVPQTYKEAAMGLGASRWRTVVTVILPAALPGILTGVVISMGRAAGETAPIIFTAAVSMGMTIDVGDLFNHPTPALPWNIYNLCTEHESVDEIRHVQYGMVLVLVGLVLSLNVAAIWMRARIAKRLRG